MLWQAQRTQHSSDYSIINIHVKQISKIQEKDNFLKVEIKRKQELVKNKLFTVNP